MLRHLGRGGLPQRVTVEFEWQKDVTLSLHRRLTVNTPIADDFEA